MPVRALYSDIDGTLISWQQDPYFIEKLAFDVEFMDYIVRVSPNDSNINKLKEFYNKGYEVIAWSASGKEWVELIIKKLGLTDYVDYCLAKPDFILDDLDVNNFIFPEQRLWFKPSGNKD